MRIAIHHAPGSFSSRWIRYCEDNKINFKIVNCYESDIIEQVKDCNALMWHFHQSNPKDVLFAKQMLWALEASGKVVFPDFRTAWHFDDKVGQKYLLEAVGAPMVPAYVFYDKTTAMQWAELATYPMVFKLRRGAGSAHVKLVKNKMAARKLINRAFGRGFPQYDKIENLKERWSKYWQGKSGFWDVIKGILRFGKTTEFARIAGNERGYVYFQDFIPNNDFDIRVIVIDGKAFAIKRMVRKNDFRASGSGKVLYERKHFDEKTLKTSFEIAELVKSRCIAIDYVFRNGEPQIVEISFGFIKEVYDYCEGFWDKSMRWHNGPFDAQGWIVESVISEINARVRNASTIV
jgi:glutathione synthase/RimK-type ligase-like ATP-grasp enzyme